jgi:hypothetical protein
MLRVCLNVYTDLSPSARSYPGECQFVLIDLLTLETTRDVPREIARSRGFPRRTCPASKLTENPAERP